MKRTLIIGYGNPDRQDDGVAWHILTQLCQAFDHPVPDSFEEGLYPEGPYPHFYFTLQLMPETSEMFAEYEQVIFVDAHTGSVPEELHRERIEPYYQKSPFTHHLTPASCLALSATLSDHVPEAILYSVRGYEFGFSHTLSPRTAELALAASGCITAEIHGAAPNLPPAA